MSNDRLPFTRLSLHGLPFFRNWQLEKEVAEKEYLCKRIMEEMKYFKVSHHLFATSSFSLPRVLSQENLACEREKMYKFTRCSRHQSLRVW